MTTNMVRTKRIVVILAILASCVGCDQVTKSLATQTLKNAEPVSFLAGTLRFEYALNPGGFLSLGGNLPANVRPWLFVGFNVAMMIVITAGLLFHRAANAKIVIAASFILAGGIGNLIDRICNNGLVTDFINVGIGPVRTGIFNVADMAVMFGGLAIVLLLDGRSKQQSASPITVEVRR